MNLLADHIFTEEITDYAIQRYPFQIIWFVAGGKLFSLTFEKSQNIAAWQRHETQGTVWSVACLRKNQNDEVFFLVDRDGTPCFERFRPGAFTNPTNNGYYSDSCSEITFPFTTEGHHLAGRYVYVVRNGSFMTASDLVDSVFSLLGEDETPVIGLPYRRQRHAHDSGGEPPRR